MKSSMAAPSFRNSGLLATSIGTAARRGQAFAQCRDWCRPGPCSSMTTILRPLAGCCAASASATAQRLARSAPTVGALRRADGDEDQSARATAAARSVVKVQPAFARLRCTSSSRPGS